MYLYFMKIISLVFLFGLTVIAYGANLSLVDCTSGMGRVQNVLVDNIEYTEFILKDKDIGCWSGDKGPRDGALYWERIEYGQKDEDTLSKNKTHVIYFRVKFEEGFVGRKETFFQIKDFANKNMKLQISKWHCQSTNRGINFLGYRIWNTHKLIRKDSATRAKRKIAKYVKYQDNLSLDKFLASWRGHAQWADSHNLFKWLEKKYETNYQY